MSTTVDKIKAIEDEVRASPRLRRFPILRTSLPRREMITNDGVESNDGENGLLKIDLS